MKTTHNFAIPSSVEFTDDNKNFVKVIGCLTIDEAVTTADAFLEDHGMCVKNGGKLYGDFTEITEPVTFNVG
jgi:hypothetical protein